MLLLLFYLLMQVYWSCSLSSYSTSLCWPYCPVTTPYLYTMNCPGLWPAWAQREAFLFLEVSSSSFSLFLSAHGRNVFHTRTATPSPPMLHTVFTTSLLMRKEKLISDSCDVKLALGIGFAREAILTWS